MEAMRHNQPPASPALYSAHRHNGTCVETTEQKRNMDMDNLPLKIYAAKDNADNVLVFKDEQQTQHACTFGAWRSDKPTKRNKWLNYNCYRYRLVWLELAHN
jgi:hypothetical protein